MSETATSVRPAMHYMADTPDAADAAFAIGDVVHDSDDPDPSDAIVVNLPSKTVTEWITYRETTVYFDQVCARPATRIPDR